MDRKLKVGIIGCGGISRLYTDIYAGMTDLAQVVATADIFPDLARDRAAAIHEAYTAEAARQRALAINARGDDDRQAAQKLAGDAQAAADNDIRTYDGHEALLKDPEIDAVLVLTTPPVRGVPVVAAAQAGKHIFTEGPMAKSVQEADEILAAVEEAGVTYISQCGGRYTRGLQHARRAIDSGLMGPLAVAKLEINWYHQQSYYMGGWHGKFDTEGGGAVFHHGRYVIEPFLFALGSPIVEVTAYSGGPSCAKSSMTATAWPWCAMPTAPWASFKAPCCTTSIPRPSSRAGSSSGRTRPWSSSTNTWAGNSPPSC